MVKGMSQSELGQNDVSQYECKDIVHIKHMAKGRTKERDG